MKIFNLKRLELTDDVYDLLFNADVPDDIPIMFSFTKNEAETFGKLLLGSRADNATRNGVLVNNEELMSSTELFFGGQRNNGSDLAKIVLETFDVPCLGFNDKKITQVWVTLKP